MAYQRIDLHKELGLMREDKPTSIDAWNVAQLAQDEIRRHERTIAALKQAAAETSVRA